MIDGPDSNAWGAFPVACLGEPTDHPTEGELQQLYGR